MKKIIVVLAFLISCNLIFTGVSPAQSYVDAYRLSYQGMGFGARALGLGSAYTGVSNDFSAVYWNPAGLGQIRLNEMSLGLSHYSYNNTATFNGERETYSNSQTNLNSLGIVYPFPVQRGSLVFAIGYGRQTDFTSALGFTGFNDSSQTILFLPYLKQRARILEDGGVNNWTAAAAIEAVKNLYIGLSLSFLSGSYSFNKDYRESDILNKYYLYELDRKYTITEDIGGFNARLGILHVFPGNKGRIGINIKFPSYLTIKENYSSTYRWLDDDPRFDSLSSYDGISEFDLRSPFVFSGGLSWNFGDLMLSGDVEYTDWTQMEFRNTYADLIDENAVIKEKLKATVNLRAGAEFSIPGSDLQLRAGFAYLPSPYTFDSAPNAQKYITGGLGYIIEDALKFDIGYAYGFWDTDHITYWAKTTEKIKTHNVVATVSYRF